MSIDLAGALDDLPDPLAIPAGGTVAGEVTPPPSKSVSHRMLNLALLHSSAANIEHLLRAEDTDLFLTALREIGFVVEAEGEPVRLRRSQTAAGSPRTIDCGNAGTMFRLLVASLSTVPGEWLIDGTPRLRERPVGPLVAALRQLGAEIECLEAEGFAPLRVRGSSLRGGVCRVDAALSSQFLSAILMAATRAAQPVTVEVEALVSAPYVEVTLSTMEVCGLGHLVRERPRGGESGSRCYQIRPRDITTDPGELSARVEGDYSAAAYPAAAAVLTGGEVGLRGLNPRSPQGDRQFLEVLSEMGGSVEWCDGVLRVRGGERLEAVDADLSSMPDQVPTLAALASFAEGTTRVRNVGHLRIKESDRLQAMALELSKVGVDIKQVESGLVVRGRPEWRSGSSSHGPVLINAHNDHRIAMSLALTGLRRGGITVATPQVVAKSYPGFWRDLGELLGRE